MRFWRRNRTKLGSSGTVTVEAALITPLLITLLFGIIEFGFIFKDLLLLHQAAREGARVAAVGATTSEIESRIMGSISQLDLAPEDITPQHSTSPAEFRTYNGSWSSWGALGDYDGENNAPSNAQIRISIKYDHPLVCGTLFSRLIDEPGAKYFTLTTNMVMSRE